MKKIRSVLFKLFLFTFLLFFAFVVFMLNPQLLYAASTTHKNITVYHNKTYDPKLDKVIDDALTLVKQSELYDEHFDIDVLLNDGAGFNKVMKKLFGEAYAWGYHNTVVLNGSIDSSFGFIHLNGYQRYLSRTIAHEMLHCLQYNKYGLFNSRPLKNIPVWKWEGYPEYVSYKSDVKDEKVILLENLKRLVEYEKEGTFHVEVDIEGGKSFAGIYYFTNWLMVKYLLDVKKLKFDDLMKDEVQYDAVHKEMLEWYSKNESS
jgi:hypothetical protein